MFLLVSMFSRLGITRVRITGGEPFVRPGILSFLQKISLVPELKEITVTSNGTLSSRYRQSLFGMGIRKINISLDALDPQRFCQITRRDRFYEVYEGIFDLLKDGFEVKLNCVVAPNKNIEDIIPFIELTKEHPLSVRFLEEMPFNGSATAADPRVYWSHQQILAHITAHYPAIIPLPNPANSTSVNYTIPGYRGSFGIIPSFSRTFCGSCNRIRLSATGELRTCLYGQPSANLRDLLRMNDEEDRIREAILLAVSHRKKDGYEAEAQYGAVYTSMSVLGG